MLKIFIESFRIFRKILEKNIIRKIELRNFKLWLKCCTKCAIPSQFSLLVSSAAIPARHDLRAGAKVSFKNAPNLCVITHLIAQKLTEIFDMIVQENIWSEFHAEGEAIDASKPDTIASVEKPRFKSLPSELEKKNKVVMVIF